MVHDAAAQGNVRGNARPPCFAIEHLTGEAGRKCRLHIARGQGEGGACNRASRVDVLAQAAGQIRRQKQQVLPEIRGEWIRGTCQNGGAKSGAFAPMIAIWIATNYGLDFVGYYLSAAAVISVISLLVISKKEHQF